MLCGILPILGSCFILVNRIAIKKKSPLNRDGEIPSTEENEQRFR